MHKPRILIPSAYHPDQGPRVFANLAYVRALEEAGALLLITGRPHDDADIDALIAFTDGLFLMGGSDMEPIHYGKNVCKHISAPDPERDHLELELLKRAHERRIPVLGICRGMQVMNVFSGGALFRDLEDEHAHPLKHDNHDNPDRSFLAHEVDVSADSLLGTIMGSGKIGVNSLHHQGVSRAGDGLRASAVAPDTLVEAIEKSDEPFWLGVQWHPEELGDKAAQKLFNAFIEAARNHRKAEGETPSPFIATGEESKHIVD